MFLVKSLKRSLRRVAPETYTQLQEAWTSRQINRITRNFIDRHGLVVQSGPFVGMQYVSRAAGSSLLPKLIGCYEAELHNAITEIIKSDPLRIIDVGCAEGYYAVGLAVRLPNAHVYAFDINPQARQLCEEMARANCVSERLIVAGECNSERLATLTCDRTVVISDCEGCEVALLDPRLAPGLSACDVLVELHDFIDRSISPKIISRFYATHDISLICSQDRDPSHYAPLQPFSAWEKRVAVAEFREEQMQWAFMRSKSSITRKGIL